MLLYRDYLHKMKATAMEDPRKDRSRFGGYSFQFVKSPPDLVMCVICHLPSKDPYLSECCGHIFCRTCLHQCNTVTRTPRTCPMCKDNHFNTFSNKQIDREVRSLQVHCSNRHYPKLRNRHGNIHAAILNGATILTTVW